MSLYSSFMAALGTSHTTLGISFGYVTHRISRKVQSSGDQGWPELQHHLMQTQDAASVCGCHLWTVSNLLAKLRYSVLFMLCCCSLGLR